MTLEHLSINSPKGAPDTFEMKNLGGVECHYGIKGNLNPTHPEQQDRASVYALPNITADKFKKVMEYTFQSMRQQYGILSTEYKAANKIDFAGNASVTMAMLDPQQGKLAIGSKGDVAVYVVLENTKKHSQRIIKRISTNNQYWKAANASNGSPNGIAQPLPVMWASQDDWKQGFSYLLPDAKQRDFTTIDLKQLKSDIVNDYQTAYKGKATNGSAVGFSRATAVLPEDFSMTIVVASDGIISGAQMESDPNKQDGKQPMKERIEEIAEMVVMKDGNHAKNLLDYVTNGNALGKAKSTDNLSTVIFNDVQFGKGVPVAACVVDGTSKKADQIKDGGLMAQRMIKTFEAVMEKERKGPAQIAAPGAIKPDAVVASRTTSQQPGVRKP